MKFWLHLCPYSEQRSRNESTCIVGESVGFRTPVYVSSRFLNEAKNCSRERILLFFWQSNIALEHWILCVFKVA